MPMHGPAIASNSDAAGNRRKCGTGFMTLSCNERVIKSDIPSEALVPVNMDFQGIPVRIVEVDGKKMIPVVDISRSLNIPRGNLTRSLKDPLLLDKQRVIKVVTTHGPQKMVCLTNHGAVGLLYKISAKESQSKEVQDRILKFQNWATDVVEAKMQTKLVKEDIAIKEDWSSVAIGHIRLAKEFASQNPSADPGMCLAIGIRNAERATGMDLSDYKKLIPPSPNQYQQEWLTATQIGREIGRTAAEVNRYLERWGYLYREDGVYYLTNLGAQYGKVFPGAFESGHNGYFIKWRRSLISAAKMRENSPIRIRD